MADRVPLSMEPFDLQLRSHVVFGEGTFERLGELARELSFSRSLIVADQGLVELVGPGDDDPVAGAQAVGVGDGNPVGRPEGPVKPFRLVIELRDLPDDLRPRASRRERRSPG